MAAIKKTCPQPGELRKLLEDSLPPTRYDQLSEHVETCAACQAQLEQLSAPNGALIPPIIHGSVPSGSEVPADVVARLSRRLVNELEHREDQPPGNRAPDLPGNLSIGDYLILDAIGRGGMGTVYRARHRNLDRIVAIKILEADEWDVANAGEGRVTRFQREMRAIGRLRHRNIVAALDAGEFGRYHYLVMEFIEGANLQQLVGQHGGMNLANACEIVRQAAAGLQHIFAAGLVHRDIKPSNIMVSISEDEPTVKILDLGLARFHEVIESSEAPLTRPGLVLGTLNYMASEQFGGSVVDIRADIYSLGATLFFLLTGQSHFQHEGENLLESIKLRALEPSQSLASIRTDLPTELAEYVDRMLAMDANRRPPTPVEVAETLRRFCDGHNLSPLLPARLASDAETVRLAAESTSDGGNPESHSTNQSVLGPKPATGLFGGSRVRAGRWLAAGFAAAFVLLAGFIIRLRTDGGDIVIECNDPNVAIEIVRNEKEVKVFEVGQFSEGSWYRSGQYEIRVPHSADASVLINNGRFTLSRGDKQIVTITIEKLDPAARREEPPIKRSDSPAKQVVEVFGAVDTIENLAWAPSESQKAFVADCAAMPPRQRAQAVIKHILDLNVGAPAPVTEFRDDELVGLTWAAGQLGTIWPLAALDHLETLKIEVACVADYRPLMNLPLRELETHVVVANTTTIATLKNMKSLETINGEPKEEFLASLEQLRTEINQFKSTMHRLSTSDQAIWLEDMLRRLNPEMGDDQPDIFMNSFRTVHGDEQNWDHFHFSRVKGLRDLSPIAIFDPPIVRFDGCPTIYDLSPFQPMKSLKGLWIEGSSIRDLSPIKDLKLDSLTVDGSPIDSIEAVRDMPLRTCLQLQGSSVVDLEPIRGKFLKRLEIDSTPITNLDPVRGMPLEVFSSRDIPCVDFSPLQGMPLGGNLAVDRSNQNRLVNDYQWLEGTRPTHLFIDAPRRYYAPDLRVLRSLECADINWVTREAFWRAFDDDLARIEAYVERVQAMDVDAQVAAINQALAESGFNGPGKFAIEDGKVVGLRIELQGSNDGLWALRPLCALRSLHIGDGVPQKCDLSALIDLPMESLEVPQMVAEQNACVIREMKSLKTINHQSISVFIEQR